MSRMNNEDALMLIKFFWKTPKKLSLVSAFNCYNNFALFVVRESPTTWKKAQDWAVKGLFVSDTQLSGTRPFSVILYHMACGTTLMTIVNSADINIKFRNKFAHHGREFGIKIPFEQWCNLGTTSTAIVKQGPKKKKHLSKKCETIEA